MYRTQIVYTYRPDGSGTLWVHRPRGTWRRITFRCLIDVIGWLSAATCTPLPGRLLTAQVTPTVDDATPLVPRAGPAVSPLTINGP